MKVSFWRSFGIVQLIISLVLLHFCFLLKLLSSFSVGVHVAFLFFCFSFFVCSFVRFFFFQIIVPHKSRCTVCTCAYSQGCALRIIEGSPVSWTCEIQGAQHRMSIKKNSDNHNDIDKNNIIYSLLVECWQICGPPIYTFSYSAKSKSKVPKATARA